MVSVRSLLPFASAALALGLLTGLPGGTARAQTLESSLTASDPGFGDLFGNAVGIDGDTTVVGARENLTGKGAAYVYRSNGATWSQEAKLVGTGAVAQDQVGFAVSVNAGAAVVGAPDPFDPFGSASGPGSAYVFRRSGVVWSQEAKLVPSDGATLDQFGSAVSLSGSSCVIGAPGDQTSGSGSRNGGRGGAYVFLKSGSVWSQQAKLTASDGLSGDNFGTSAALDTDLAVVGAPGRSDAGASSGAAYVFRRSGTVWTQEAKLVAADAAAGDLFGYSVSVSGNAVVIGAYQDDGAFSNSGSAYVFRKNGASWVQEAKLVASDAAASDAFGVSVSMLGSQVVAGCEGKGGGAGAAYVFGLVGGTWTQQNKITKAGTSLLGSAVAIAPDHVALGAPVTDGTALFSGAAYVYNIAPPETLLSISPTAGLFHVQTPVTLTGTNFSQFAATTVLFGGVAATNVAWVSPTQMTCSSPIGTQGATVSVSVKQYGVTSTLSNAFTYTGTTVTTVSPNNGPSIGGPPVTITGTNFVNDGSTTVLFGGNSAGIVSITPPGSMVVNPPPGTRGSVVNVSVNSSNGLGTLANAYSYDTTTVTSVTPNSGPSIGGPPVTIHGTFFINDGSTVVKFGANTAGIVSITPPNTIVVNVPPGTRGSTVPVSVNSNNGLGTLANAFTYDTITITSVSPSSGPSVGGPPVTITGTNFINDGSTAVTFGANTAGIVSITPPSSIVVNVPPGTRGSTVNVSVTCNNGSATKVNAFTYQSTTITAVAPSSGPSVGGPPVTITGTNFINDGSTTVSFGANAASIVSITPPGTIVVNVPPGTRGSTVPVSVNSNNGLATLPNAFTYATLGVTAINTPGGNIIGGTPLTVTVDYGTTLADTSATLGGSPVAVTAVTPTSVSFVAPPVAQATGTALDVSVTNSNGTGTLFGAFTYTPALYASVSGNTTSGGTLTLDWLLDPAVGPGQLVTIWLGDFNPPLGAHINGYAGLLQRMPLIYLLIGWPEASHPVPLPFPSLDPVVAGLPLHLQAVVTGEGGPKGSFSNDPVFVIP